MFMRTYGRGSRELSRCVSYFGFYRAHHHASNASESLPKTAWSAAPERKFLCQLLSRCTRFFRPQQFFLRSATLFLLFTHIYAPRHAVPESTSSSILRTP